MYFVKYGKEYLHDPRVDGCMLLDLSLNCEENSCGYCDFTIYPDHPMYSKIREHDASNQVEVYDDDVLLFAGFIYELGKEFYLDGHVKCKGELDYLRESIVRPYSTELRGYGDTAPNTINGFFEWLIAQHNSQVNENKRFVVGINQGSYLCHSNAIFSEEDSYPNTIDEISNKLLNAESVGGYLRVRHQNGVRYIDYLSEWTDSNTQILDFGVNLTDYIQTDDSDEIATYIVPVGARMADTEYEYNDGFYVTSDTQYISGTEYYTLSEDGIFVRCSDDLTAFEDGVTYYEYFSEDDESNVKLTLYGLDNGEYDTPGYKKAGDIVYCESAVNKYGWIGIAYENRDVTDREQLRSLAETALKKYVSPKRSVEVKAVDMHLINNDIKSIQIGEYVRIRSNPHNLDSYFLCTSIDLDLNNPENSLYTLGTTFDTLTGQQNKRINALNSTINKQYEEAKSIAVTANNSATKAVNKIQDAYASSVRATEGAIAAANAADAATARVTLVENQISGIEGNTTQAIADATAAAQAAGEATAIANQIQNEISDVKGDATSLRDAIEGQIETTVTTMTATYVSETDLSTTETTLRSEISSSAAALETTVSQTYAKKTELTEVESNLSSTLRQHSDSIGSIVTEVTTVRADVTTAQTAANAAQSSANAAQASADAAGINATTAQAAADAAQDAVDAAQSAITSLQSTVSTKFSEVDQTSDAITTRITSAETTITNLESSVTSRFSEVEETAEGITVRVGEVETDLSHLVIGGRNLYLGTRNFDGGQWNNLEYWTLNAPNVPWYSLDDETWVNLSEVMWGDLFSSEQDYAEYGRMGSWMGIYQEASVVEGEEYTFSFYAKGDPNASISVYTDWDSMATTPSDIAIGGVSNDIYTRYSVTFTANVTGSVYPRVENTVDDSWLQICALKFEHGSKPTDWTPAPEDMENAIVDAKKAATDYLNFSTDGLTVGEVNAETLGANVNISGDGVKIRDGETILAKFDSTSIEYEEPVVFKADGIMLDNGDAFAYLGRNNILWTHATGVWMNAAANYPLTTNITRQLNGAVFAWCPYVNGSATNSEWKYFFVPKSHITSHPGAGVYMSDPYLGMMKYIYISNGNFSGCDNNATSGTTNGIAWNNTNYVLRYVIGV